MKIQGWTGTLHLDATPIMPEAFAVSGSMLCCGGMEYGVLQAWNEPGLEDIDALLADVLSDTWRCDYCGSLNSNTQLACGEGMWSGCGAAKP